MKFNIENSEVEKLCHKLVQELFITGKHDKAMQEFHAKKDINQKVLFVEKLYKEHNVLPNFEEWKEKKDPAKSDLCRNEGNKFFREKKFMDALKYYNER